MNYFFVFQNKSYRDELNGGYLWAPKFSQTGKKVSHWENMKSVKKGDRILHSYHRQIVAISVALRDVYEAKRPIELSDEWMIDGWRVDCEYIEIANPINISTHIDDLLRLQPLEYAPFNRNGSGNPGYLFNANEAMYQYIIQSVASPTNNLEQKEGLKKPVNRKKKGVRTNEVETKIELEMKIEEIQAQGMDKKNLIAQIKKSKARRAETKKSFVYYRSPFIKALVKLLANGTCQMCGEKAPFCNRFNEPYLEEHHVKQLAEGGSDTMDNVVAICPNCHRRIHVLREDGDQRTLEFEAKKNYAKYLSAYVTESQIRKSRKKI